MYFWLRADRFYSFPISKTRHGSTLWRVFHTSQRAGTTWRRCGRKFNSTTVSTPPNSSENQAMQTVTNLKLACRRSNLGLMKSPRSISPQTGLRCRCRCRLSVRPCAYSHPHFVRSCWMFSCTRSKKPLSGGVWTKGPNTAKLSIQNQETASLFSSFITCSRSFSSPQQIFSTFCVIIERFPTVAHWKQQPFVLITACGSRWFG